MGGNTYWKHSLTTAAPTPVGTLRRMLLSCEVAFKSKSTQDLELGTQSGLTLSTENTLVDWRSTRLGRFKWCVDHNNGKHTLVHKGAHYSRTASAKFSNLEFIIPSYHHQLSNPIGRRLHIRVSFRINGEKEVK